MHMLALFFDFSLFCGMSHPRFGKNCRDRMLEQGIPIRVQERMVDPLISDQVWLLKVECEQQGAMLEYRKPSP